MTYVPAQPREPSPPPILPPEVEQNLGLLSILFYLHSGLVGLSAVLFGGFAILGLVVIPTAKPSRSPEPDPALIGAVVLVIFGAVALFMLFKMVIMILAGRAFGRRSGYVMCMVGACMALINIPLGTALGVFALITLMKPGVRERLGGGT